MTRQEAISVLKKNKPVIDTRDCGRELCEACDIAIDALERPDAVDVLQCFFPDEPCNYNNMDDYVDGWCAVHCREHTVRACWEHAIKERWYE